MHRFRSNEWTEPAVARGIRVTPPVRKPARKPPSKEGESYENRFGRTNLLRSKSFGKVAAKTVALLFFDMEFEYGNNRQRIGLPNGRISCSNDLHADTGACRRRQSRHGGSTSL